MFYDYHHASKTLSPSRREAVRASMTQSANLLSAPSIRSAEKLKKVTLITTAAPGRLFPFHPCTSLACRMVLFTHPQSSYSIIHRLLSIVRRLFSSKHFYIRIEVFVPPSIRGTNTRITNTESPPIQSAIRNQQSKIRKNRVAFCLVTRKINA
jgi:hypothetical protein